MSTILVIGHQALTLVSVGAMLGIGFWASKKLTNLADEKLLLYDKRKLKQLSKEMELDHG